ncbi:hypothetical protein MAR_017308 [Mya arenaria]|uniref:B box-type domain-containing protein n=1 Tax=Mya arenaria TaxID=6604 RepID=A0ABY7EBV1_MYAAR|nr:uncharacterized protein LOC128237580 [Mya arenaria]WAR07350.1 hypothetical protein MAR_017308 [Mya arenaria]
MSHDKERNTPIAGKEDLVCFRCSSERMRKPASRLCMNCDNFFCEDCLPVHEETERPTSAGRKQTTIRGEASRQQVPAIAAAAERADAVAKSDVVPKGHPAAKLEPAQNEVVGKGEVSRRGTIGMPRQPGPTDTCEEHPGKPLELFCTQHNTVGCSACMTDCYRTCTVLYIPDNLHALFRPNDVTAANNRLRNEISALEAEIKDIKNNKTYLAKTMHEAEQEIDQYSDSIIERVEELRRETKNELKKQHDILQEQMTDQVNHFKEALQSAKRYYEKITRVSNRTDSDSFIQAVYCDQEVDKCRAVRAGSREVGYTVMDLEKRNKIIDFLSPLHSFGKAMVSEVDVNTISETMTEYGDDNESYAKTADIDDLKQGDCSYKGKTVSILKFPNDNSNCDIMGASVMEDGSMIFTDRANKRLKRVHPQKELPNTKLNLPDAPWSLCVVPENCIAVTLPDLKTIQFFAVESKLKIAKKKIQTNFKCFAIANNGKELFVSDFYANIYVYVMPDSKIHRILRPKDRTGNDALSAVHNMAVSDNGGVIYVADANKGLFAIESGHGRVLWRVGTWAGLSRGRGVCLDGHGGLYVSGCDLHNVIHVTEEGRVNGEVERKNGVCLPQALSYDRMSEKLIVAGKTNNVVALYFKHDPGWNKLY